VSGIVGYLAPLGIMAFGLAELFFGLRQGRTFSTYAWQPRWAHRRENPVMFWGLMFIGAALALFGATIFLTVILEPSCWNYLGAVWLCSFDRSWS
jgi:hypothetical protein